MAASLPILVGSFLFSNPGLPPHRFKICQEHNNKLSRFKESMAIICNHNKHQKFANCSGASWPTGQLV